MTYKKVAYVTTLLAIFGSIDAANAITFNLSAGTTGPNGVTNQGTYSSVPGATTIDFNSGNPTPTTTTSGKGGNAVTTSTYNYTNGIATYNWSTTGTATTAIKQDQYAPVYQNGSVTTSSTTPANSTNYLAVFGEPVTITFSRPLNYFGLDWGRTDVNNTIAFYKNTSDTTPTATFKATDVGLPTNPETSSYVNFNAANSSDTFSKIVLSNGTATGFETDNHAIVAVPFGFSPGLGILGLGAWGAIAQLKSKLRKQKSSERIFSNS